MPVVNSGKPLLADLLTIESTASIFFSYARELELSQLFGNPHARTTVLVPTNKAVIALPRKPLVITPLSASMSSTFNVRPWLPSVHYIHEASHPLDDGVILSEAEFDAMSKKNVERWVSAHIIPVSTLHVSPPLIKPVAANRAGGRRPPFPWLRTAGTRRFCQGRTSPSRSSREMQIRQSGLMCYSTAPCTSLT